VRHKRVRAVEQTPMKPSGIRAPKRGCVPVLLGAANLFRLAE
jgi:hypothetical protein